MSGERPLPLSERSKAARKATPEQLCEMLRQVTGVAGTGVMLSSAGRAMCSASSGEAGRLIEDLQFTLGVGPSLDADRLGAPVLVPDLSDPTALRWMTFAESALDLGIGAVFSFPLRLTTRSRGALALYVSRPGPLRDDQHAIAMTVAAITARAVLGMEWRLTSIDWIARHWDYRPVVHQAAGMMSEQLAIGVEEGLVRLRAHAVGGGRPLGEVAADVVARRLRFDDRT